MPTLERDKVLPLFQPFHTYNALFQAGLLSHRHSSQSSPKLLAQSAVVMADLLSRFKLSTVFRIVIVVVKIGRILFVV